MLSPSARPRHAEVGDLGLEPVRAGPGGSEIHGRRRVTRRQEHIARLQIAVYHPATMGLVRCLREPLHELRRRPRWQRGAAHSAVEAAAIDVLHREVQAPLALPHLIHLHDVRMPQPGGQLRFVHEACTFLGSRMVARQHHLEGRQPIEPPVAHLVDHPHPTAPQLLQDLVVGDVRPPPHRRRVGARLFIRQGRSSRTRVSAHTRVTAGIHGRAGSGLVTRPEPLEASHGARHVDPIQQRTRSGVPGPPGGFAKGIQHRRFLQLGRTRGAIIRMHFQHATVRLAERTRQELLNERSKRTGSRRSHGVPHRPDWLARRPRLGHAHARSTLANAVSTKEPILHRVSG